MPAASPCNLPRHDREGSTVRQRASLSMYIVPSIGVVSNIPFRDSVYLDLTARESMMTQLSWPRVDRAGAPGSPLARAHIVWSMTVVLYSWPKPISEGK